MRVTFQTYVVHVYSDGGYARSITEPMNDNTSRGFCRTYNELHEGDGEEAVRELVEFVVDAPATRSA